MYKKTIAVAGLSSLLVAGCGGGGGSSSSGGSQASSNAANCITTREFTPSTSLTDPITGEVTTLTEVQRTRFTNNCAFTVNVATHFSDTKIVTGFLEEFALGAGGHRDLFVFVSFTACQDPSRPVLLGKPFGQEENVGCS